MPYDHGLEPVRTGELLGDLAAAALGQDAVADAAAALVLVAVFERTTGKYGNRGVSYVHMEVGGAAENVCLQAAALRLGTVFVGAFEDDRVHQLIGAEESEHPLCILPVGEPATDDA
jgi:SagB-type dehydrogenase family enzyme